MHIQKGMTHSVCSCAMAKFLSFSEYWVGGVWNSHLPLSCLTHSLQPLQEKQESKYGNSETTKAHTSLETFLRTKGLTNTKVTKRNLVSQALQKASTGKVCICSNFFPPAQTLEYYK